MAKLWMVVVINRFFLWESMVAGISMTVGSKIFNIAVDLGCVGDLSRGFVKKLLIGRGLYLLHRLKKLVLVLGIV